MGLDRAVRGADIGVADGTYRRVDIMVKDDCQTGDSLAIENDNGVFTTSNPKILRFNGEIVIDSETESMELNIVPFIQFFDSVNSNGQLQGGVQQVNGTF